MLRRMLSACLMMTVLTVASRGADAPAKTAPSANPTFEKLKKLVGTWVEADKDGKPTDSVASVIRMTAGGSAIEETLFPGTPKEMVSVYTVDKGDVVMTHYCILGNQPRMKADPASPKNTIHWLFTGGTNLDPAKDTHMHSAILTFVDDDHIQVAGEAWVDGKPSKEHCGEVKLVRKK